MVEISEIIVVEGKYDKIRLSGFLRASILETSGFGIYNDPAMRELLLSAAAKRGLIVLTDSDSAGFQIRRYLRSFIPDKYIKDVYVPALKGKEKRKAHPSRENILGVEGLSEEILMEVFRRYGIETSGEKMKSREEIRTIDLYRLGLSGRENSRKKMVRLLQYMSLPERLSTKEACEVLNIITTKAELQDIVHRCLELNG